MDIRFSFSTKHNRDGACKTRSKLSGIFPRWKGVRGVIRELPKEIARGDKAKVEANRLS